MRIAILLLLVSIVSCVPSPDANPAPGDILGFLRGIIQQFVPGNRHSSRPTRIRQQPRLPQQRPAPRSNPPAPTTTAPLIGLT